jgi:NhaP-type Na+/H+ or K+/H+ antiporter
VNRPPWKLRRRAIFGSLFFAGAILVYVMVRWDSTSLAETLALGSFGLIGTVVAAYVGGAAYEDVRLFKRQETPPEDDMGEEPHVH